MCAPGNPATGRRVSATVTRLRLFASLTLAAVPGFAQTPSPTAPDSVRSSITGAVRDSLGLAVSGASVLVTPGGLIYRTDSAGQFRVRVMAPGAVTIGVRKPGFAAIQSRVTLQAGADLALDLVMERLPRLLAEVEILANRECARFSIEGILCRREKESGYFMNRQEILAKNVEWPMLVLRDVPGFRQNLNGDPRGVESTVGWRCIVRIVDGGFPYSYNPIVRPADLYAVEVYHPPDIPPEYQHHYWARPTNRRQLTRPCTLVVMWTMREAQRDLRRLAKP